MSAAIVSKLEALMALCRNEKENKCKTKRFVRQGRRTPLNNFVFCFLEDECAKRKEKNFYELWLGRQKPQMPNQLGWPSS